MVRCVCFILVLVYCHVAKAQEEPYFKLYTDLTTPQVDRGNFHILQDSAGYMWVSNVNCLKRFDGKRFKYFLYENQGMAEKGQVVGFKDSRNRIWFIGLGGRVTKYENGRLEPYAYNDTVSSWLTMSNCISLWVDSNEVVHFGLQSRGYFQVSPSGNMTWMMKQSENASGIYYQKLDGRLFVYGIVNRESFDKRVPVYEVGTDSKVVLRTTLYDNANEDGAGEFSTLRYLQRQNGSIVLAMNNKLVSIDGEIWTRYNTSVPMTGLFEDSRGGTWLSSIHETGVHYSAEGGLIESEMSHFVDDDIIHAITEDRQGGIWLSGGRKGLHYHGFPYFRVVEPSVYDTVNTVDEMTVDFDRTMLFGSHRPGYINSFDGEATSLTRLLWAPHESRVLSMNRNAGVLHLSSGRQLWRYASNKLNEVRPVDSEFKGTVRSFSYNADSSAYWISAGLMVCKIEEGEVIECSPTQPYEIIETVFFEGQVYIGTRNGLWRLEGNVWTDLTNRDEHFKGMVGHLTVHNKTLWVFNYEKGAALFRNDEITHFDDNRNCLPMVVHTILQGDSLLALSTLGRLNIITEDDSKGRYQSKLVPGPFFFSACASEFFEFSKGNLDFGATDGNYYRMNLQGLEQVPIPEVQIGQVSISKRPRVVKTHFILPYDSNDINISFIGFSYHTAGVSHYRYRMTGIDDWTTTTEPNKRFTTLPPGDYTFDIAAHNVIGQESDMESITFTILPPYYQTWWFRSIYVSVILLAIWLLFKLRINQLKRKSSLLADLHSSQHQALSARMSPHFIFNALNSIQQFTLKNDKESAAAYMRDYSQLMRLVMENSRDNLVDLESEVKAISIYLNLERLRSQNRITYEVKEEGNLNCKSLYLPALFLQPYLENAIWHGLMSRNLPGGHIAVRLSLHNGALQVVIEDDGIGRARARKLGTSNHPGFESEGMDITEKRIELINRLYKVHISITIEDLTDGTTDDTGTRVTLIIPQV